MNAKNFFTIAALLALTLGSAQAQAAPTGEEIVQRSIEASGGEAAQNAVKTWYSEAEMEIVGMGLTGSDSAGPSDLLVICSNYLGLRCVVLKQRA